MNDFNSLGLAESLLDALRQANHSTPTPIQAKAIPLVLKRSDVLGIAQTGTGKTAAFALPLMHLIAENRQPAPRKGCRALILAPTRELAAQIAESFETYGKGLNLKIATVYGGASPRPQRNALARGIDILVATPGRLIDHMGTGVADLSRTEFLVLDEADQMLDLGFLQPLRRIVAGLPKRRQTLFFSATMSPAISKLAGDFLHQPTRISVAPAGATADRVTQRVIHVSRPHKRKVLAGLLNDFDGARTLVFTRTKRGADNVAKHLSGAGTRVSAIHGNKSQGQRERALEAFRSGQIDVLVATDIAARGIDIDAVENVINYELPDVPEAYVHRIGRTARAGASGQAYSLCDPSEHKQLRDIERLTGQRIQVQVHEASDDPVEGSSGGWSPQDPRANKAPRRNNAARRPDAARRNRNAAGSNEPGQDKVSVRQEPARVAQKERPHRDGAKAKPAGGGGGRKRWVPRGDAKQSRGNGGGGDSDGGRPRRKPDRSKKPVGSARVSA